MLYLNLNINLKFYFKSYNDLNSLETLNTLLEG